MADTDTTGGIDLQQLLASLTAPQAPPAPPPVDYAATAPTSASGLLGERLAGGPPSAFPLSQAQRDVEGNRDLLGFARGLMSGGPFARGGDVIAGGLQGAAGAQANAELAAAGQQQAAQEWQNTSQANRIEMLKAVLPLIKMQQAGNIPNPLLGGGATTPGMPGSGTALNPYAGMDKEAARQAIIQNESGGKNVFSGIKVPGYTQQQTGSGYYQMIPSTWQHAATLAGIDTTKYPLAINASKADQDKAFDALWAEQGSRPWWRTSKTAPTTTTAAATPTPTGSTAPPAASAVAPGVTMAEPGVPPPPPPGPPGAAPGPVAGIGAALNPIAVTGSAGNLQSTGRPPVIPPPVRKMSDADIIMQGVRTAQATPVLPGAPLAAGGNIGQPAPLATAPPAGPAPNVWGAPAPPSAVLNYNGGPTTVGPATPAPQPASKLPTPPPVPPAVTTTPPAAPPAAPGRMTFEQFQTQHPITPDPSTYTVTPPDLGELRQAQVAAAQQLDLARRGISGDPNKSLSDYNTATAAITKAQQDAQTKSLELQQTAQAKALDTQRQLYNDEMTRQQQFEENDKQRAATLELEKVKAGQTFHQKLEEESAQYAQDNTLKPMGEQAMKAHQMNLGLSQLLPVLQDLPPSGGALGTVLDAHPDLAPLFNSAGILNDRQADAVRLLNGLVANISTEMKPTGLGALREYEWDAFKAQLPGMLSTPAGQQKAVAMLMNMNNRIQSENGWMNSYFNRKIPDETATTPGATRSAHNLEGDGNQSPQQRMDADLGPLVPRYTGPPTGSGQAQWEQSLPPGKPYYKTWGVPDPQNPGQPLRDSAGRVRTTTTLEVRPWQ